VRTWLGRLLEQRRQRAPGEAVAGPR